MVIAVSASPHHVVELFAQELGFDRFFGTIYEVHEGAFTGKKGLDTTTRDKSEVIRLWAHDEGISVDYEGSYAIGDTEGDIHMLEKVGNPIAFNPNRALVDHALAQGWKIVVERKDVIYDIKETSVVEL
jgi:phosphoserine phosphatase